MTIRKAALPIALVAVVVLAAALAVALAALAGSPRSDRPGVLPPLRPRPVPVTMGANPVRVASCKDEGDGHVTIRGLLVATRRATRPWVVQFQVASDGALIEEAYAFLSDVPAGSKPVPFVGSGTLYVTGDRPFTCDPLAANPLSRNRTAPSR